MRISRSPRSYWHWSRCWLGPPSQAATECQGSFQGRQVAGPRRCRCRTGGNRRAKGLATVPGIAQGRPRARRQIRPEVGLGRDQRPPRRDPLWPAARKAHRCGDRSAKLNQSYLWNKAGKAPDHKVTKYGAHTTCIPGPRSTTTMHIPWPAPSTRAIAWCLHRAWTS